MNQIGNKGAELNLLIKQGATFGPVSLTLNNPDATPVNLTGCSLVGAIRKTPNSPLIAEAQPSFQITDALLGKFEINISDDATDYLIADASGEYAPSSIYVWQCNLVDAAGRTTPLLYGDVNVFRKV